MTSTLYLHISHQCSQLHSFAQSYVMCTCLARGLIPGVSVPQDECILSDIRALLFDLLVCQYPVMSEEIFEEFFYGHSRIEDTKTLMNEIFRNYAVFCSERFKCFGEVCACQNLHEEPLRVISFLSYSNQYRRLCCFLPRLRLATSSSTS